MNKIYQAINQKTNGKFGNVRFGNLAFSGNNAAVATVLCRAAELDAVKAAAAELTRLIRAECAFHGRIDVEIRAVDESARALRDGVIAFTEKFPFVASIASSITAPSPTCVKLKMHESMRRLAADDFLPRLSEYLENNYFDKIDVRIETVEFTEKSDRAPQPTFYEIKTCAPITAGFVKPDGKIPSCACVNEYNENAAACGVVAMATEFMSKGGGAKRSRPYEKFLLVDGENSLQCRFFPSEVSVANSDLTGKAVVAVGAAQVERGRDEATLTVRELAVCDAPVSVPPAPKAPTEYVTVRPEPYEEYVQGSLFQTAEALAPALKGVYVAFDFETTGLSLLRDKPTELGAVKITDGVITETFHTLIDPKQPIPDIVSQKTGITDDMVKGKPLFEDVLPDFYKFTYGCRLIGHNISFDFPFLVKHGNRHGWTFGDRRTFDTMGIAPKAIPGIEVLTLDNVLEKLGLINDNAHRALSDATATAKAFIAMQKMLFYAKK